ncbi:ArsR/SmtB family transcription factor [Mangrovibacillus cuniculi]|nr:metalloregulator ArsR/SmtB family transcription factor [Mangrovibacillus cuniculi]
MATTKQPDLFHALGDPTRRQLLQLLMQSSEPIVSICEHFNTSRTAVVKHLQVLLDAGLVTKEKQGRQTIFHLSPEPLSTAFEWLSQFEPFWEQKLNALDDYLSTMEKEK